MISDDGVVPGGDEGRHVEAFADRSASSEDGALAAELAARDCGTSYGGIGAMQLLVERLGLAEAIDRRLHLFKIYLPYHESDHVLNVAYNALSGGTCLEDLELRRQDEAYLNALGARPLPDPTTAGDFCRRFGASDIRTLLEVFDETRRKVWARQPREFFGQAPTDDGRLLVVAEVPPQLGGAVGLVVRAEVLGIVHGMVLRKGYANPNGRSFQFHQRHDRRSSSRFGNAGTAWEFAR
jgi:hypothetical protein